MSRTLEQVTHCDATQGQLCSQCKKPAIRVCDLHTSYCSLECYDAFWQPYIDQCAATQLLRQLYQGDRVWGIRTPGYSGFDDNSQPKTFNQISKVPGFKIKNMIAAMDQKEQEVEKKYKKENHARDHFLAHMEASKVKHLDRLQEI